MNDILLTPLRVSELKLLIEKSIESALSSHQNAKPTEKPDFLSEYIPKAEVRGKLASSSTLWKYEKQGRITAYAIGGKRFYKKEDLEALFVKLDKVGGLT